METTVIKPKTVIIDCLLYNFDSKTNTVVEEEENIWYINNSRDFWMDFKISNKLTNITQSSFKNYRNELKDEEDCKKELINESYNILGNRDISNIIGKYLVRTWADEMKEDDEEYINRLNS